MRLSVAELTQYRQDMAQIAAEASEAVREALESYDAKGVADMRRAAIETITQSVGIHGDRAQAIAGQLFSEVCAAEGMGPFDFELYDDIIDFAQLEEKVRWLALKLTNGDRNGFIDASGVLAEAYAWRCNRTAMVRNCEANGVRYARVPTNSNACEWCVMLASRGFVYHSADLAEAGGHAHCQCIVCPGGTSTSVEGYDPDAYYDQWRASGFMPSKTSVKGRMVANDVGGKRTRGQRAQSLRGMRNDEAEAMFAKMNAAKSVEELEAVYKEQVRLMLGDSRVTDADFADIGNHYAYLLEERKRKRGRR